jgi:hypothetical protein
MQDGEIVSADTSECYILKAIVNVRLNLVSASSTIFFFSGEEYKFSLSPSNITFTLHEPQIQVIYFLSQESESCKQFCNLEHIKVRGILAGCLTMLPIVKM